MDEYDEFEVGRVKKMSKGVDRFVAYKSVGDPTNREQRKKRKRQGRKSPKVRRMINQTLKGK